MLRQGPPNGHSEPSGRPTGAPSEPQRGPQGRPYTFLGASWAHPWTPGTLSSVSCALPRLPRVPEGSANLLERPPPAPMQPPEAFPLYPLNLPLAENSIKNNVFSMISCFPNGGHIGPQSPPPEALKSLQGSPWSTASPPRRSPEPSQGRSKRPLWVPKASRELPESSPRPL